MQSRCAVLALAQNQIGIGLEQRRYFRYVTLSGGATKLGACRIIPVTGGGKADARQREEHDNGTAGSCEATETPNYRAHHSGSLEFPKSISDRFDSMLGVTTAEVSLSSLGGVFPFAANKILNFSRCRYYASWRLDSS
jgi:hypothetical protein